MNSVTAPSARRASRDEFCDLGGEVDEARAGGPHRQSASDHDRTVLSHARDSGVREMDFR